MHHVTAQIAQFFQLRRALAKWITATEDAVMLEVQNIHATRIQAVYRGHLDRMDVLAMRRAIAAEEARKLKVRAICLPFPASRPACLLPLGVDLLHGACQSSPHRFAKSGSGRQSATNDAKRAPLLRGEQALPLMGSTFSSTLRYTSKQNSSRAAACQHVCLTPFVQPAASTGSQELHEWWKKRKAAAVAFVDIFYRAWLLRCEHHHSATTCVPPLLTLLCDASETNIARSSSGEAFSGC